MNYYLFYSEIFALLMLVLILNTFTGINSNLKLKIYISILINYLNSNLLEYNNWKST